jgi:hypothetical protein
MPSLTPKSNKCHEDCFIKLQYSSAHKEDLTQPLAWISHKSHKLHLEVKGRGLKVSRKSIFVGGTSTLEMREGKNFYTIPQKLAVEN